MEIYLVGGAVRDELLRIPVKDRDWVVVGATAEDMLARRYKQVGRDFPVFLDPRNGEEYALARTERKTGRGYTAFSVHAAADVTLEDDLRRRDLTINAMARDDRGCLIDPFNGRADLEARRLRHVSPAFAEDPLRVLRAARFAARFSHLGFTVAPDTLGLMQSMVAAGELEYLVPERVWRELGQALAEASPQVFLQVLRDCGALALVLPEVDKLFGVPQPARYHPEIDTGVHTLMALEQAARLGNDPMLRFAALVHDLGKALTPSQHWPSHRGHEALGEQQVAALCERLRVPNNYRDLGRLVCLHHTACHRAMTHGAEALLDTLEQVDALRRPERFEQFLKACEADARGRTGLEHKDYPQAQRLRRALAVAAGISAREIAAAGYSGPEISRRLRQQRIAALREEL